MKGGVRPINKHFFRNKSVGTFFFSCWYRLYIVHTSFSMWLMPKLNTNSKLYVILRHFFALTLVNVPLYELSTWEWKACLFVENFCEVPWNFHKWTRTRDLDKINKCYTMFPHRMHSSRFYDNNAHRNDQPQLTKNVCKMSKYFQPFIFIRNKNVTTAKQSALNHVFC